MFWSASSQRSRPGRPHQRTAFFSISSPPPSSRAPRVRDLSGGNLETLASGVAPALQWHSTRTSLADGEFDKTAYRGVAAGFEALLDSSPNERAVQGFLKRYRYIVRNALNVHAWNSVHLQPEFSLGGKYVVDFLILSEDSGGWRTVLIELESPTARPFTKKGNPSKALAKGLAQLAGVYWEPLRQRLNPSSLINMQSRSCITHARSLREWTRP
jgi:hypothetical protein